jgi:hypothetical protein
MGDRFYTQQKNHKAPRILKKDIIVDLQTLLGVKVEGLDRLTVKTLQELCVVLENRNA